MTASRPSLIRCTIRLLEHKSRALEQAAPLAGWQLPDCFLCPEYEPLRLRIT
jgi:hypothetical protein